MISGIFAEHSGGSGCALFYKPWFTSKEVENGPHR